MRRRSGISLGIAILCATVAALLVRVFIQGAGGGAEANMRTIVVAARAVSFGVSLTAENLREVSWPADGPIAGSFSSIQDLTKGGRRLSLTSLQRNEPILVTKVTAPDQRATLSTQIDEGMRAVTVRVDEVRGVAGFILPGDHVDVVLTRNETIGRDASAYADLLLQNINVLAIDQLANERQDKPSIARAVTLELTPVQAQRVILAQGIGQLSLLLRQAGEPAMAAVRRVTSADLGERATTTALTGSDELQARLDEVRRSVEEKNAQRIAELEARLRNEIAENAVRVTKPVAAPAASLALPLSNPVVNVIRNGSKREQYTVAIER